MRSFIISLSITTIIIVSSVLYGKNMTTISNDLLVANDRIVQAIDNDDYDNAKLFTDKLNEYLNTKRAFLAATDNHEVIDKIEINLRELYTYIEGQKKADALSRCNVLGLLYEHLPKNYELKLENIL